jgi:3-deoxy-D-manno-octulosonic-acid transferase
MFDHIECIGAHGQADAERFIALGADPKRVVVTGSIKFDLQLPADLTLASERLREQLGQNRFIWVAASTHAGEEEKILAGHQALREKYPDSLLVLVPRHPERFDAVAKMCEQSFVTARRSQSNACTPDTAVYLADTMGELMLMYGAADVAFIGGSFVPTGGHNMLEPAALAKPILTGTHLFNFAEISQLLLSSNAMTVVQDEAALTQQLLLLANDATLRTQMGQRAKAVVDKNRGALARQLSIIEPAISAQTANP